MVSAQEVHRALLVCLVVGLAFSCYAMAESLDKSLESTCNVNPYVQCGAVDTSQYSHVGPIPDYAIGIGGFVAMLVVEVLLVRTYDPRYLRVLFGLSLIGVVVSAGLGYTELALINPSHPVFCPICLGAYLSNLGALACIVGLLRIRHASEPSTSEKTNGPKESEEGEGNGHQEEDLPGSGTTTSEEEAPDQDPPPSPSSKKRSKKQRRRARPDTEGSDG